MDLFAWGFCAGAVFGVLLHALGRHARHKDHEYRVWEQAQERGRQRDLAELIRTYAIEKERD